MGRCLRGFVIPGQPAKETESKPNNDNGAFPSVMRHKVPTAPQGLTNNSIFNQQELCVAPVRKLLGYMSF